ncbi:Uncharacterised protein [Candidatus Tiddalikarchaeum anstoanum]|nr:Uncharacterised protein [Candidatus Tiddalikarchaeum anstoanum]
MGNYTAYVLILLGVLILAYNYGYLSLSILVKPLALPTVLIIVGFVELATKMLNAGDFGRVLRTIGGIILVITLLLNLSTFILRLSVFNAFPMMTVHDEEPIFGYNGSNFECSFCNLSANVNNGMLNIVHDGELVNTTLLEDYTLYNKFGESSYDFGGLSTISGGVTLDNSFGNMKAFNMNGFSTIFVDNKFGEIDIHTGVITRDTNIRLDSKFGVINAYIDSTAEYLIESSSAFGTVSNFIGLKSANFDNATNRVHIVTDAAFGTINLYKE